MARPNFLGIGAARCGTTTLARLLAEHPQVSFPRSERKELHFFDEQDVNKRNMEEYFKRFDANVAVGEFTPSYLFDPKCRDLIFETIGADIKFIVILRNPVERAYSHYCAAIGSD